MHSVPLRNGPDRSVVYRGAERERVIIFILFYKTDGGKFVRS